jgi:hypothetical protein
LVQHKIRFLKWYGWKYILYCRLKKMRLKNRGSDKLKNDPKTNFIAKKWRTRKVDGSWFFDPQNVKNDQNWLYSDLWKNSPHKKHCAWARTPPWEFYEIYRILLIFCVFGPSIQPEKPSPKSASTPYPPSEGLQNGEKVIFLEKNRF